MISSLVFAALAASLTASVPKASRIPVIDGVLSPGEWNDAVSYSGLMKTGGESVQAGGEGSVRFLTDGKWLCAAWRVRARNVDIGGGLKADAKTRDGAVYSDDEVELVVEGDNPDRIAHFIFNSIGTVYDSLNPRTGKRDIGWNCRSLKVASKVLHGWWVIEAALPLAEIGPCTGKVKVNASRGIPGMGSMSVTGAGSNIHGEKILLEWAQDGIAVQLDGIGEPADGRWLPSLAFTAGAKGRRLKADLMIRDLKGQMGKLGPVRLMESKVLSSGELLEAKYLTRSRDPLVFEASARDAADGRLVFFRRFVAERGGRTESVPATARFDIGAAEGVVYHYPGMGKLRINVYPAPEAPLKIAAVKIAGRTSELERKGGMFTAMVDVPEERGEYRIDFATVDESGGRRLVKNAWKLVREVFEWEGNSIGEERVIVPPFKPIAVQASKAGFIMRDYELGAAGLPASVKALGRELLAAPVRFEAVIDSREVVFEGPPAEIADSPDGYDAVFKAGASAAGVAVAVSGRLEYDGFAWYEARFTGVEGKTVDRLSLIMPIKDREAPLMHICTVDSIRSNPTGAVPKGEGVVWDGRGLSRYTGALDPMFAPQVVPYVWLGAEQRGISWFVNDTCGMRHDPAKSALRIRRVGKVLQLEADFITRPSRLKEGHAVSFGIQATPVKPVDRALGRHFQNSVGFCPEGMISRFTVAGDSSGFWNSWARRPWNDDWSLLEANCRQAATAAYSNGLMRAFTAYTNASDRALDEYAKDLPVMHGKTPHVKWMRSVRAHSLMKTLAIKKPSFTSKYSDPTLNWKCEPAQKAYRSEWVSQRTGYIGAERNFLTPSYIDYCMFYYEKLARSGVKGIYFDDMFPMTCRNPDTSAKCDDEGVWHGSFGILEMRELVKRTAVMQHTLKLTPRYLQVHMTNCLLVPAFAFATSAVSWEDHYGEEVFQKRFPLDYVRAESLGSQVGLEAVALDGIYRRGHDFKDWKERHFDFLTRTQQAVLLPLGVKTSMRPARPFEGVSKKELFKILEALARFEVWADDCEFIPAWSENGVPVAGHPEHVLAGVYRRPGRSLAVFGNQQDKSASFALKVDRQALGLEGELEIFDAETREKLDSGRVEIPAYDVRLVTIEECKR